RNAKCKTYFQDTIYLKKYFSMEERSLWQELRLLLTNIAGNWSNTEGETMVFSVCEKSGQEGKLIVTDKSKNAITTVYSINTYLPENLEPIFYIDAGADWDSKRWYKIKEISPASMLLIEISKSAGRKEVGNEILYTKKTDGNSSGQIKK
ncbi:MAG: hypothetical protein ABJB86_23655, partial [Bacteroidota bacterium]